MTRTDAEWPVHTVSLLKIASFLVLYRILLDIWYVNAVAGIFVGYPEAAYSISRLLESIYFCLVLIFIYPRRWDIPSSVYFSILIVGVAVPMSTIYAWNDFNASYLAIVAFTLILMRVVMQLPRFAIPYVAGAERVVIFISISAAVVTLLWLIYATRGSFVFDFTNLYDQRISNREFVTVGVWGYVISWTGKVIVPLMISFALIYRKYLLAIGWFVFQVLVFSLSTQKFLLFVGVFPFFAFFVFKKRKAAEFFLVSVLLFFSLAYCLYLATNSFWVSALAVQRPVFKPSLLNFEYFRFFLDRPHVMLSNSVLSPFVDNPYAQNPAFLIGQALKGSDETRSNTAFLGTGFAHFGYIGVVSFGLIVALILRLIDSATKGVPLWLAISVTFGGVSSMLVAADLFPSLNTHGVIFSILMLALLRRSLIKAA